MSKCSGHQGKIGSKMKDDLCILNELGWIDAEGEGIEEAMKADLKTLPANVYKMLSEDVLDECADKLVNKMAKKHKRCAKMHTADEAAELSKFGLKVASYKCFQKQFAKSCQGFVKEEIYNLYKEKMSQDHSTVVAALV
eukprot:TRINITY_DN5364_c0_g1_i3.p1 TRINITY_DN5364_c0_g1~~TRINITY_DN5364_c0_g1_i3.p1  ORF type:complete len:139 (-),score=46.31 TRINITY_DN5364_c0_g1_i3:53-469(-)